jgi:membrane-bound lytic murein transglycosylase B
MSAIVVLTVALMSMAAGVAVVAALHLRRAVAALSARVKAVTEQVRPLVAELADTAAVTTIEAQGLQRSVARLKTVRPRRLRRER